MNSIHLQVSHHPRFLFLPLSFFWNMWGFAIPTPPFSGFRSSFNDYLLFLNCKLDLTESNVDLGISFFPEQYTDLKHFNSCHYALLPYPLLFPKPLDLPWVYTSQIYSLLSQFQISVLVKFYLHMISKFFAHDFFLYSTICYCISLPLPENLIVLPSSKSY